MEMFTLPYILAGLALLFWGKKIFWFLVGTAGFVLGVVSATYFFYEQSDRFILTVGLVFGFLGIFLAIFLQRIAVGIAGFVIGAYTLFFVLDLAEPTRGIPVWIYGAGGVTGLILAYFLFDWALVVLSSLAGAMLIMEQVYFGDTLTLALAGGLFFLGIWIQTKSSSLKKEKAKA